MDQRPYVRSLVHLVFFFSNSEHFNAFPQELSLLLKVVDFESFFSPFLNSYERSSVQFCWKSKTFWRRSKIETCPSFVKSLSLKVSWVTQKTAMGKFQARIWSKFVVKKKIGKIEYFSSKVHVIKNTNLFFIVGFEAASHFPVKRFICST